jgi:hypothetical protein
MGPGILGQNSTVSVQGYATSQKDHQVQQSKNFSCYTYTIHLTFIISDMLSQLSKDSGFFLNNGYQY